MDYGNDCLVLGRSLLLPHLYIKRIKRIICCELVCALLNDIIITKTLREDVDCCIFAVKTILEKVETNCTSDHD